MTTCARCEGNGYLTLFNVPRPDVICGACNGSGAVKDGGGCSCGEGHYCESEVRALKDAARVQLRQWQAEHLAWRKRAEAAETKLAEAEKNLGAAFVILDGFDERVFIRDISHDHESGWAVKLLPFTIAIGRLAKARDAAREGE
jgi:hypothetical protein